MLYDAKNPIKTFNCYFIMRLSNFRFWFKQLIARCCYYKSSNTVNDSVTMMIGEWLMKTKFLFSDDGRQSAACFKKTLSLLSSFQRALVLSMIPYALSKSVFFLTRKGL